ncbi:MAG: DegV family protein, partial [Erysipelotrichaceae bacterium]|nr:DegV family protein [Erysipelotrichaceae bacterium]
MLQKKFVISADTSADFYQSQYEASGIHYILMGVVYNGQEKFEVYNSEKEFETFYENLKKGALPTTTQLNYFELSEYFKSVLAKEPEGDIIHVTLSSGLSGTHNNALMAASDLNEKLVGRKIYVFDSLSATTGVALQLDRLVEMRDAGIETEVALARLQEVRDHEQTWAMIGDLFHLKRGGRISGVKAVLGKMFHA